MTAIVPGAQQDLAGSFHLHHVGHAVADMRSAVSRYCDQFGYLKASEIIHDPLQTAYVQFLQLAPANFYLELVAPDGPESKLTAFTRKGGGLHHLCYTVPALEKAIEALSTSGLRMISEPKPAIAFAGRRICWLLGADRSLVELIEGRYPGDSCAPVASSQA